MRFALLLIFLYSLLLPLKADGLETSLSRSLDFEARFYTSLTESAERLKNYGLTIDTPVEELSGFLTLEIDQLLSIYKEDLSDRDYENLRMKVRRFNFPKLSKKIKSLFSKKSYQNLVTHRGYAHIVALVMGNLINYSGTYLTYAFSGPSMAATFAMFPFVPVALSVPYSLRRYRHYQAMKKDIGELSYVDYMEMRKKIGRLTNKYTKDHYIFSISSPFDLSQRVVSVRASTFFSSFLETIGVSKRRTNYKNVLKFLKKHQVIHDDHMKWIIHHDQLPQELKCYLLIMHLANEQHPKFRSEFFIEFYYDSRLKNNLIGHNIQIKKWARELNDVYDIETLDNALKAVPATIQSSVAVDLIFKFALPTLLEKGQFKAASYKVLLDQFELIMAKDLVAKQRWNQQRGREILNLVRSLVKARSLPCEHLIRHLL